MKRWLIFECNSDYDSLVAVIRLDDSRFEDLVSKARSVKEQAKTDEDLHSIAYWEPDLEAYESPYDIESVLISTECAQHLEEKSWTTLVAESPGDFGESLKTDISCLNITTSGYIWWTFTPKHGGVQCETPSMSIDDLTKRVMKGV